MSAKKGGENINKLLLAGLAVIIVVAGIFYLGKKAKQNTATTQPTEVMTVAPSISATPSVMTSPTQQTSGQTTVTVTATGFDPQTVTIKAGDKVTWVNKSGDRANVSSDPHPVHTNYPPLNLGSFADGASVSLMFDKPGTYGYHNHLNPSKTGTVIVQ
ncbi:MAG TPA: cupredoxin domain-containing protein [Candidatus Saccharimonadales bacterium]|nr:cupredoxin domain-containing protein [Candidatus Saccharimonadales bacterium]